MLVYPRFRLDRQRQLAHPGWLKTLGEAGYRVIAMDSKYGGATSRMILEAYRPWIMAADSIALLDLPGIRQANLIGHRWARAFRFRHAQVVRSRPFKRCSVASASA